LAQKLAFSNKNYQLKEVNLKKKSTNKQNKDSFFDDTFSYLNLDSQDGEALFEEELKMNNLLEDYNIEDLDLSDLDVNFDDEISLI
jgi:hypothetical protein